MFCRNCGAQLPPRASTCPICRTRVPETDESQSGRTRRINRGCWPRILLLLGLAVLLLVMVFIVRSPRLPENWPDQLRDADWFQSLTGASETTEDAYRHSLETGQPPSSRFDVSTGLFDGEGLAGVDLERDDFRDYYTRLYGDGRDVCTLMVYMIGSDLESEEGAASADLQEMLAATTGKQLNLLVQTGGAKNWRLDGLDDGQVQRWLIRDGLMTELADLGRVNMAQSATLADFISFCAEQYPANRYGLILWDHGGGAVYGFGWDELFGNQHFSLPDLAAALDKADLKFDFVGFDACLMASVEVACLLDSYADYLIASQETEPGVGWYYTEFLERLGQNTSLSTPDLGRSIINSFIRHASKSDTLSLISLRESDYLYQVLCRYLAAAAAALDGGYSRLSGALANTTAFADGYYDLFDLVDLTNNSDFSGEEELVAAVNSAVKYRNDCARLGVYGLSCYFPYAYLEAYGQARSVMSSFGFGDEIYACYDKFVSIMGGGQTDYGGFSLRSALTGAAEEGNSFDGYPWYDPQTVAEYDYQGIPYEELTVLWSQEQQCYYLPLRQEDWELITGVELQVLLDNGSGYLDLGSDQYWEEDEDGNLLLNYGTEDNTWVAVGGQIVAYYAESAKETDSGFVFSGSVPARLNGQEEIELILCWNETESQGYIAGYRPSDYGQSAAAKGLDQLEAGDELEFLFDFYDYDGVYGKSLSWGGALSVGEIAPVVTYEYLDAETVIQCYMITDVYNNHCWTQAVEFSD